MSLSRGQKVCFANERERALNWNIDYIFFLASGSFHLGHHSTWHKNLGDFWSDGTDEWGWNLRRLKVVNFMKEKYFKSNTDMRTGSMLPTLGKKNEHAVPSNFMLWNLIVINFHSTLHFEFCSFWKCWTLLSAVTSRAQGQIEELCKLFATSPKGKHNFRIQSTNVTSQTLVPFVGRPKKVGQKMMGENSGKGKQSSTFTL